MYRQNYDLCNFDIMYKRNIHLKDGNYYKKSSDLSKFYPQSTMIDLKVHQNKENSIMGSGRISDLFSNDDFTSYNLLLGKVIKHFPMKKEKLCLPS